jgi:hypothetical protein
LYVFWRRSEFWLPVNWFLVQKPEAAAAGKKAFLVNQSEILASPWCVLDLTTYIVFDTTDR